MLETAVQQRIRLAAAHAGLQLFRNNSGACHDQTGRLIRYGLGNDSEQVNRRIKSPDLIGWTPIFVTPDMVGKVVAVFTGIECKASDWRPGKDRQREAAQQTFIDLVLAAGGKAGFANDPADVYRIMQL